MQLEAPEHPHSPMLTEVGVGFGGGGLAVMLSVALCCVMKEVCMLGIFDVGMMDGKKVDEWNI